MDFARGELSGCVEINFDDNVEEGDGRRLRKSGRRLREGGHSQKNDRHQRNNHRLVNDRHQTNRHNRSIVVFRSDLESKDENKDLSDAPDNKGLDRIVDHHEMGSTHREDRHGHAYLKEHYSIQD